MKRKKLLATAVASTLVAAQMVMPAAAATGGGSVDVDVTNTDTVLRVEVPTSLQVAVDEYEIAKDGSQISSAAFEMVNKSAVPVSVAVTSTATVTSVTLADSDEVDNTADEMWLAVAAQTEKGKYGVENIGDLTAKSVNVATFAEASKEAAQTFYLAEAGGNVTYKYFEATAAGKVPEGHSFGEYYKLTDVTIGTTDAQGDLDTAVAASDVYVVKTADGTVTKVDKGTSAPGVDDTTYDYYTAAAAPTAQTAIAANDKFVYAEMDTVAAAGGEAAFRYIGKLSTNKTWSKDDFSKIVINYTITGLNSSVYADAVAAKDVVYGLYTAPVAPSVPSYTGTPLSEQVVADTEIRIPVDLGSGSLGFKSIKVMWKEQNQDLVAGKIVTLDAKTTEMVISASAVNTLLQRDDAAAAGSKLLPLTMEVYFNGNTTPDAVITLSK